MLCVPIDSGGERLCCFPILLLSKMISTHEVGGHYLDVMV